LVEVEAKIFDPHLEQRLTWKSHIQAKRKKLDIKFRQMHWLLRRTSTLYLNNKLLLYKAILKLIWSNGVQLWGCAKSSRLKIIQGFHSKLLRHMVNAPWYVSNELLHNDLHIPSIIDEIRHVAIRYHTKTRDHANHLTERLYRDGPVIRRLRRTWPEDVVHH
jgi:hypothetical protein